MVPQTKVSIVSAYYKHPDMTRDFIANLPKPPNSEFILVNAGNMPIVDPKIDWRVDLAKNHSFANSMNAGISRARGEYVVVIGNDVFPRKGWIEHLLKIMESNPKIWIAAPRNDKSPMSNYRVLEKHDRYDIVAFFPAVCWMIRRKALDAVGLFDERFKVGTYEDNDYVRRVQNAGGQLAVSKQFTVKHLLSQTMRLFDVSAVMDENLRLYEEKWRE